MSKKDKKVLAIKNSDNLCWCCLQTKDVDKIKTIYIGSLGYGSYFDMCSSKIQLCEDCYSKTNPEWWKLNIAIEDEYCESYEFEDEIIKYIRTLSLQAQELFFNTYMNDKYYMEAQDWIDYELGILPHEKCKEYEMYSPQEIKAYKERFPTCQHPFNLIYEDGSKGCWCPFDASGEYGQKCSLNISSECYQCNYYKQRENPIKDIESKHKNDYEIYQINQIKAEEYKNKFG